MHFAKSAPAARRRAAVQRAPCTGNRNGVHRVVTVVIQPNRPYPERLEQLRLVPGRKGARPLETDGSPRSQRDDPAARRRTRARGLALPVAGSTLRETVW